VDLIRPAQDRSRWQAVVNAVMKLQVLVPRNYLVRLGLIYFVKIKPGVQYEQV
jgi:hypothetical protein